MSVTELGIRGMTCASCATHVTRALRRVPGVEDAAVNLATERATILLDQPVSTQTLIDAVEGAGYGATADLDADREALERAEDLRRKRTLLTLATVLFIPTLLLALFAPATPWKPWVLGALALPVWAIAGWPFHRAALSALRNGTATMDTLVSLGSTAAFALGVFEAFRGGATTFDTASAIITLISLGKYIEARARAGSSDAMRSLLALRPAAAKRLASDGTTTDIPVELVYVDDRLAIAAGRTRSRRRNRDPRVELDRPIAC